MIRHEGDRIDPKRKNTISYRKKQFANATYKEQEYPHKLNLYTVPPTAEITLEEFEQWAIDRLRSMPDSAQVLYMTLSLTYISTRRARSVLVP